MDIIYRYSILYALLFSSPSFALQAHKTSQPIKIDGLANEEIWQNAEWHPIKYLMLGNMPSADDFSGKFKISWDHDKLYLLVNIVDDVLTDSHPNPYERYWDDDTLEVFIDEDASGGNHLHSFNAFAYHIALDGNVADFGNTQEQGVVLLNDHVESRWTRNIDSPYDITWEVAISIYPDSFSMDKPSKPTRLMTGKKMGFMLAYCDNDGSPEREHFIGSHEIEARNGDKNLGYIDASVFGSLTLIE